MFSLNLLLDSEFFIRLASVVFMTANTYIIFRIGKELKDARTGLYAALLFTASIYAFVITGIFIMPDTPLMLFWLLAVWSAVRSLSPEPVEGPVHTIFRTVRRPRHAFQIFRRFPMGRNDAIHTGFQ